MALGHLTALSDCLASLGPGAARVADWGRQLSAVLQAGGRLLTAGNGGSAAQAQHLTAELVGRYCDDRRGFSAICLSAETSSLTAIANDYGCRRGLRPAGRGPRPEREMSFSVCRLPGPVATSCRRPARHGSAGLTVWAITGAAPNPLAALADDHVGVEAATMATVQEAHLVLVHVLCEAFDGALFDQAARKDPR